MTFPPYLTPKEVLLTDRIITLDEFDSVLHVWLDEALQCFVAAGGRSVESDVLITVITLLRHVEGRSTPTVDKHPNRYCLYFGTAETGLPGRCLKAPGVQMCPASECLFRKEQKGDSVP